MNITFQNHPTVSQLIIAHHDSWCFYGTIDSGIGDFFALLTGDESPLEGAGIISFETLQELYEDELRNDDSDYLDYPDPGTFVGEFLPEDKLEHPLIEKLSMEHMLDTGFRHLSSGQTRKLLLLKEILSGKTELVIYLPYDGLDAASCKELDKVLAEISEHVLLVLLVQNQSDIPHWCSHLGVFANKSLQCVGIYDDVKHMLPDVVSGHVEIDIDVKEQSSNEILVHLKDGVAGYGELQLFSGLDLTIESGQHTLVTGPNGCGKSTLLHIITGDHPNCYSNDLKVFGIKRGTGESIWDIKKDMGIISPELHRNHRCPGTALDIVIGGLFDSIGLYRRATVNEKKLAKKWLKWLGLSEKEQNSFRSQSFAEQRLVLIARGLIKMPRLLILDEPTQGLDEQYRYRLLQLMEKIAQEKLSTILFVSHREDEHRDFFTQQIALEKYASHRT